MEGKIALITGGARGLGEAMTRLFALHGAKIVVADVLEDLGRSLCDDLNGAATFVKCDVTVEEDIRAAVNDAILKHGKLDVMCSNAGVIDRTLPSFAGYSAEKFDRVIAVNLRGAFLGTKHAARVMVPARQGSIIITSSVVSVTGASTSPAYTSSKHALVGLAKTAALSLGQHGIRVNCVAPGPMLTAMSTSMMPIPRERLEERMNSMMPLKGSTMTPEDVARAALFLASDESKFVSGQNLGVDGAMTAGTAPPPDLSKLFPSE